MTPQEAEERIAALESSLAEEHRIVLRLRAERARAERAAYDQGYRAAKAGLEQGAGA